MITQARSSAVSPSPKRLRRPARNQFLQMAVCERLESRLLLSALLVTTTADSGAGSLRQAITAANTAGLPATINFNIPGTGIQSIDPTSDLPTITVPITIDGTTQPGYNFSPLVEFNFVFDDSGLTLTGGTSTIKGLILTNSGADNLSLSGAGNNTILGNYIGTDGLGAGSTTGDGINIAPNCDNNTIGDGTPDGLNVISGNSGVGINISAGSTGNSITFNFIGTNAAGTVALGNLQGGISIAGSTNTIADNTVSGNNNFGIELAANNVAVTHNAFTFNFIGTDLTGAAAIGNHGPGLELLATGNGTISQNTIGSNTAGQGNVISGSAGNVADGILLSGTGVKNNSFTNNWIGTGLSGLTALPNANDGIEIEGAASNTFVANVIAGNTGVGVLLNGSAILTGTPATGNIFNSDFFGMSPDVAPGSTASVTFIPNGGTCDVELQLCTNTLVTECTASCTSTQNIVEDNTYSDANNAIDFASCYLPENSASTLIKNNFATPSTAVPSPTVQSATVSGNIISTHVKLASATAPNTVILYVGQLVVISNENFTLVTQDETDVANTGQTTLTDNFTPSPAVSTLTNPFVIATTTPQGDSTSTSSSPFSLGGTSTTPIPTTTTIAVSPADPVPNAPITLTATVSSATGSPAGTVTFFDGVDPLGNPVPVVNHKASFTQSNLSPGDHTFEAVYTSSNLNNFLSSMSNPAITDVHFTPTKLTFPISLQPLTAGVTGPQISVDVSAAGGQLVTTDSSPIQIAITSEPPGAAAFTPITESAVDGAVVFPGFNFDKAGVYTAKVTDGNLTPATLTFTVNPAAATSLLFPFVTNQLGFDTGIAITNTQATAFDPFGNVATQTSGICNLTFFGAGAPTPIPLTTAKFVNGHATFPSFTIDQAGTFQLQASFNGLSAVTDSFTENPGAPAKLLIQTLPSTAVAGQPFEGVLLVTDKFGNTVPTDSSDVTVSLSAPAAGATLSGNKTSAAVAGEATIPALSIQQAGTYRLRFTDATLTAVTSTPIIITPAAPDHLEFLNKPTTGTAGVDFKLITVGVFDAFDNLCTSDNSSITLGPHNGTGTITFGQSTESAVNGVAQFSHVNIELAGSVKLVAFDNNEDITDAFTPNFPIVPGPVASIAFFQEPPLTVTAGATIIPPVTVQLFDQFGNLAVTDHSPVTLNLAGGPPGGKLFGTATAIASNGVATFTGLSLQIAGNYTLHAREGTANSLSTTIDVIPAASAKLVVVQQPLSPSTVGDPLSSTLVDIEDKYGNVVTSDGSNIIASIKTPTGATLGGTTSEEAGTGAAPEIPTGQANFDNLILNTAGNYTLLFTDGNLTPATSNSISTTAATQLVFTTEPPEDTTAGIPIAPVIKVTAEDGDGHTVTSEHSKVTLTIQSGPNAGKVVATATLVSGVATFTGLSFQTAGDYVLTATDGSLTANTSEFIINAAAPKKLAFITPPPSSVVAGTPFGAEVAIEDQFGNIVHTDASAMTVALKTGPKSATLQNIPAVQPLIFSGEHTFFGLDLTTTGNYTLVFTESGLPPLVSGNLTVTPSTATQLQYVSGPKEQSVAAVAGAPIKPALVFNLLDSFGNLVTNDSSNVTLSALLYPGGSVPIAGTTTVAALHGVATFSNILFDTVGSYALQAADASLQTAATGNFTITPAPATQMIFLQSPPANVTAGATLSPAVTVELLDQFNNIATNNSSLVTLTTPTEPTGGKLFGTASVAAVHGLATFANLSFQKSGTYILHAADGLIPALNSGNIAVGAGAAAKLVFVTPLPKVTINQPFSLTVDVTDAFGNINFVDATPTTVTLALGTHPAAATLTSGSEFALTGFATFGSVTLNEHGSYTLVATDNAFSGNFTSPIIVV